MLKSPSYNDEHMTMETDHKMRCSNRLKEELQKLRRFMMKHKAKRSVNKMKGLNRLKKSLQTLRDINDKIKEGNITEKFVIQRMRENCV